MANISIDLETFSGIDIKKAGAYKYVSSPIFKILLVAYAIDDEDVQIIDCNDYDFNEKMIYLHSLITDKNNTIRAYNAVFEWLCLSRYYDEQLSLDNFSCTMIKALYLGLPSGLEQLGKALGLEDDKKKLATGKSLINLFCKPNKPTKSRPFSIVTKEHEPGKWELFREYCKRDVEAERTIAGILKGYKLPDEEEKLWILDTEINKRGVLVDSKLIEGAIYCHLQSEKELLAECKKLTGVDNPKSVAQLKPWLESTTGSEIESLNKKAVEGLKENIKDVNAIKVLELRQELSKTSVKKYDAMVNVMGEDNRARGLLQYYGANRTGRWAGRLVQVQNLPRNKSPYLETARKLVKNKDVQMIKLVFGNVSDILSQLVRTAFIASPGNRFIVADFSAIEARVIAWLAKENWRLEVFKTHGKIYEASASAMFNVPLELIKKGNKEYELRQKGKIAELALGYQGGVGALKQMGALEMGIKEEELDDIVKRWRASNPNIVALWYGLEKATKEAIKTKIPQIYNNLIISLDNNFLIITLPSKRALYYYKPVLKEDGFGRANIYYKGSNQSTKKWEYLDTYGGKLVENVVQAIARDCLAVFMQRASSRGYDIVMHIHDEIVADVGDDKTLKELLKIMEEPISWANGLTLKGDGFETVFYRKD